MHSVGSINKIDCIENEFGTLKTSEVIITDERLTHILERHSDDYELYSANLQSIIETPDRIIVDPKNENSIFMIKKIDTSNVNVVVRLMLAEESSEFKNSVITMYQIREKNVLKLEKKGKVIYKKV